MAILDEAPPTGTVVPSRSTRRPILDGTARLRTHLPACCATGRTSTGFLYSRVKATMPSALKLVTGLSTQLPVKPVGMGGVIVTVEPCMAPLLTLALNTNTGPGAAVRSAVSVDVSPLFHVMGTTRWVLPIRPPRPTFTQPRTPLPVIVAVPEVYGVPVSTDEHGIPIVPNDTEPPAVCAEGSRPTPGDEVAVRDTGQTKSTGVAEANCAPASIATAITVIALNTRPVLVPMLHAPKIIPITDPRATLAALGKPHNPA
jgi:hypothetical protein